MKYNRYEEFDLATTYQKLIAPSSPRTVKARDFFKQPDLLTPLKHKLAKAAKQASRSDNR